MEANTETVRELVVPVGWIIAIVGTLGGVIATLAKLLWTTMKDRLSKQDQIIDALQKDVDRMSVGCGHPECHWKNRTNPNA